MEKASMSLRDEGGGCRIGWYPRIIAFFITAALGLSIMSSLDCSFLAIDLGFVLDKYYSPELGFGLWSHTAPDGRCLSYKESHSPSGGGSGDDFDYSSVIINNDMKWSISRILAMAGVFFGILASVSIWINVWKSEPHLVDVLIYSTITSFMCECSKFGLFLLIDLCRSPFYWYSNEADEYSGSKSCGINRGALMSMCSIGTYLVSMIMAIGFAAIPKEEYFNHDDASLTSLGLGSENGCLHLKHESSDKNKGRRPSGDRVVYNRSSSDPPPPPEVHNLCPPPPRLNIPPTHPSSNRRLTQNPNQSYFSKGGPSRRLTHDSSHCSNMHPSRRLTQSTQRSVASRSQEHQSRRPNRRLTSASQVGAEDGSRSRGMQSAQSHIQPRAHSRSFHSHGVSIEGYGMRPHQSNMPPRLEPIQDYGMSNKDFVRTNQDHGMIREDYNMVDVPLPEGEEYLHVRTNQDHGMIREDYNTVDVPLPEGEEYLDPELAYPPPNNASQRTHDDCSVLTWDPGY